MSSTEAWHQLARTASRQHAVVTSADMRTVGFDASMAHRAVRAGRLLHLHRGVYAVAGAPPSADQAIFAAVVANGPEAKAFGLTTAVLMGLPVPPPRDGIHVLRPWQAKGRQQGVVTHRTRHLHDEDAALVRRIPVTSLARTILDISGHPSLDDERMQWLLDVAVKDLGLSLEALERAALRLPGGPGRRPSVVLAALRARVGNGAASSPPERRLAQLLVGAGFGPPEIGMPVAAGGRTYELDLAYPVERVDIEYKSRRWHGDGLVTPITSDSRRVEALKAVGWEVVDITGAMSDAEVVRLVGAALARGERRRATA